MTPSSPSNRPLRRPHRAALAAALLALLAALALTSLATPPTASACPPQGCHQEPDDPPPPRPPSVPVPKYRLTLHSLTVYKTEDSLVDETYIKVKGSKVAGPHDMSYLNATWQLGLTYDLTAPLYVEVYDKDGPDPDDWLGTAYPQRPATVGATSWENLHFTQDGAHYAMLTSVTRLS